ncbi:hypothetical protein Aph01nite_77160 [Acrocarpospora phusangensis]|uniref:Anaphase-promoting complex subunit 4 WD40 domain-containing protein n=1 Tax=Acrocarpospora phusangensis TaxID=1070424 RepID=A0A919QKE4_9ACTN|nr:hypothetical protein Aph01nite_77160 [Acrocarpospora phusangensis]
MLLVAVLLVAGVVPRASSAASAGVGPRWPYAERLCEERPRTGVPAAFGPARIFGGDEHTNITGVAFGRLGGRPVAVSTGQEGTMRVWALPALTPRGAPVRSRVLVPGAGLTIDMPPGQFRPHVPFEVNHRLNGRALRVTADDEMRVVDIATGRQVGPVMYLGEDNSVNAVALFSLGGRLTAAVNDNGGDENDPGPDAVTLWDLASGREAGLIEGDFSTVRAATVGGRTVLLTVNRGNRYDLGTSYPPVGTVSLWDPATRREISRLPGNPPPPEDAGGYTRIVYDRVSLAVGELDGRPVALTGGGDNTLRLWDLTTATQLAATTPNGHTDVVESFTVAELDGRRVLVSGSADSTVMVWDLSTLRRLQVLRGSNPAVMRYPRFADIPGAKPLITTWDGELRLWQLDSSGRLDPLPSGAEQGWFSMFHGRPAHLGEESGGVRLRDLATRAALGSRIPITGEQPVIRAVLTQLDGRDVVIDVRNRIRIWDLNSGRRIGTILDVRSPGHKEARPAVAQANCTTLVLSGAGPVVRVWDLRTGRELRQLTGHGGTIVHIRTGVIGDRPIAVTASEDGTIRVWNLIDGAPIGEPINVGRRYGVVELTELNGRTLLIRAGRDERIQMWDLGG